ncbi:LAMI_0E04434g1_1 [Lachancea mirantina]|uniref:LAMI_0E04434g1_1 n=1 Tax=Lachancea mirantina TaxID=1230905 RepID=A0A1G4JKD0_9SACH|nr:LAMI_0E04434g1_1 [Lachancea mirantina]
MKELVIYNLNDNSEVFSPCIVVHGKCSAGNTSSIQVQHPQLPPLNYAINDGGFKCVVLLLPGANRLTFITNTNISKTVTCTYSAMLQDAPIHLCLLVGRDSPLQYDSPQSQIRREGGNNIDMAIRKLRLGARLMQAFTAEQMLRNGFGPRTFQFVEEYEVDTTFRRSELRNRIKVHILPCDKTAAQLRDPNLAQQNPKASDAGGLFGIAMDALRRYGGPFTSGAKPVQAAVMFLDTHWDRKINLLTAHAALGGGDDSIKLAIFGSHGLFSWPLYIEDVPAYLTDDTRTSTDEVANDANECGTHWETLVVTLGAFMHEIGHLLGSPHRENGVMLRDYVTLNRSFLTREAFSVRTNSTGAKPPILPREECTWNRIDLLKFLYHASFTTPQDFYDPSFMRPGRLNNPNTASPILLPLPNECICLKSETGIFCIELVCDDLARAHIEYLPQSLGGTGPQKEIILSLDELRSRLPPDFAKFRNSFKLRAIAVNSGEEEWSDLPLLLANSFIDMSPYGLPNISGVKTSLYGDPNRGRDVGVIPFDGRKVGAVRVYFGAALDGIRVYMSRNEKSTPSVPPRTYMGKITEALQSVRIDHPTNANNTSSLFGNETNNFADVVFEPGEYLAGFNVRSGAWIDAVQVISSTGRLSQYFGNANGGGKHQLLPPHNQQILGLYGRLGQWVDGIGLVYGSF